MTIQPSDAPPLPGGALFSTPERDDVSSALLAGYDAAGARSRVQFSSTACSGASSVKSKSESSVAGAIAVNTAPTSSSNLTPLHRRSLGLPFSTPTYNNNQRPPSSKPWMPSSVTRFFGRAGRIGRASQLGLSPNHALHQSFEANQSFPRAASARPPDLERLQDPEAMPTPAPFRPAPSQSGRRQEIDTEGMYGASFSTPQFHGSFAATLPPSGDLAAPVGPRSSNGLGRSWSFLHFLRPEPAAGGAAAVGTAESSGGGEAVQMAVKNPNKAVLTIDKTTSDILIANDMAGDLFGIPPERLIGTPLSELLDPARTRSRGAEAAAESLVDVRSGDTLTLSGKVIDVVHASTGVAVSVSVWVQELKPTTTTTTTTTESDEGQTHSARSPCIVILEPVDRLLARLDVDSTGVVRDCDATLLQLWGFDRKEAAVGRRIDAFLPGIKYPVGGNDVEDEIPKEMRKQHATAISRSRISFPVSLILKPFDGEDDTSSSSSASSPKFTVIVWVFANISGLVTFDPSGLITAYNGFFMLHFLGYDADGLLGLPLTAILPNFYEDVFAVAGEEDADEGVDDSSWPMPPDLETPVDAAVIQPPRRSRGDTEELLAEAQVFVDGVVGAECTDDDDRSTIGDRRPEFKSVASGDIADCEDNDDDEATSRSTLLNSDNHHSSATAAATLYSPTMPDRPYSPSDPPYSPARDPPTSLFSTDFDVSNVSPASPNILVDGSLARPEEPTPARWPRSLERPAGSSPYSPSQRTPHLKLAPSTPRFDSPASPIFPDDFVVIEKNKRMTPTTWKSGSVSTYVAIPSPFRERDFQDIEESAPGSAATERSDIASVRISLDDSVKAPFACSLFEGEEDEEKLDEEEKIISIQKAAPPPRPASALPDEVATFRVSLGVAGVSTSTPAKEAPLEPSPVRRRLALGSEERILDEDEHPAVTPPPTLNVPDGAFSGRCLHQNGALLSSLYQIKKIELEGESPRTVYCMWLSKDPRDWLELSRGGAGGLNSGPSSRPTTPGSLGSGRVHSRGGRGTSFGDLTLNSTLGGGGGTPGSAVPPQPPPPPPISSAEEPFLEASLSLPENRDDKPSEGVDCDLIQRCATVDPRAGVYRHDYETLQSIGKGAYGYVKLARRRLDDVVVVVKFIKKSKLSDDAGWVVDEQLRDSKGLPRVPLEVSLLSRLRHPNVVRMIDCYDGTREDDDEDDEDDDADSPAILGAGRFFHLVMEKHGAGMDLFEFIDRGPNLDEPLCSFIFRQLVEAVDYLHSQNVVHRDIKDENVIIDEQFQVKLIDFGSAALMRPGKTFSIFCGTMEYCSPEVLKGNPYSGPELEVWSLGVTLYTLVFGENPFLSVNETLAGVLHRPAAGWGVSRDLLDLLRFLLHPDLRRRATVDDLLRNPWIYQPFVAADYRWDRVLANTSFHGNTAADYRTDSGDVLDAAAERAGCGGGKGGAEGEEGGRTRIDYRDDYYDDDDKENEDLFGLGGGRAGGGRRKNVKNEDDDEFDEIQELRDQMQRCLDLETWG